MKPNSDERRSRPASPPESGPPGDPLVFPGLRLSASDPREALQLAAGTRQRLGELLSGASRLTSEQVERALEEQRRTGEKLGDVLIRLGYVAPGERDVAVEFQRYQGGEAPASEKLRLGAILVATGAVSETQVTEALERARSTGRRIGEELVAAGHLPRGLLNRALGFQRELVMGALIVAMQLGRPGFISEAQAGQVRAYMAVTANVVGTTTIRTVHQASALVVTARDIERGYVEIPAGSRFEIQNRGPCLFEFRSIGNLFRAARVTGPEGTAEFRPDGGTMLQSATGDRMTDVTLSYRFELAPGIAPGTHDWPLLLSVLPM